MCIRDRETVGEAVGESSAPHVSNSAAPPGAQTVADSPTSRVVERRKVMPWPCSFSQRRKPAVASISAGAAILMKSS